MERAHIDISRDLDGEPVVHACFDLAEHEIAAAAHAVAASATERFRMSELSADEVIELRELTALADELRAGMGTLVMRPARLSALRDAVACFVDSRVEAEWIRDEDREPLALASAMLPALEHLCAEALRAALSPSPRTY
jgi:hypothetical protein